MENPVRQQAAACAVVLPEPEQWKDIAGYEGIYQVSDLGRVKSIARTVPVNKGAGRNSKGYQVVREKILIPDLKRGLYPAVSLCYKGRPFRQSIHVFVAAAFVPNPHNKPTVNHISGDKLDARAKNLEWCTYSENMQHSYEVLGRVSSLRKLTEGDVEFIRSHAKKGCASVNGRRQLGNIKETASALKVSITTIHQVLNGKCYV